MMRAILNAAAAVSFAVLCSCMATVGVAGDYDDVDTYPPDAFIATATPVYFEGRPAYWWGNRWYFRDGGRWAAYRHEPAHLRETRARAEPARHFYGRASNGGYRHR